MTITAPALTPELLACVAENVTAHYGYRPRSVSIIADKVYVEGVIAGRLVRDPEHPRIVTLAIGTTRNLTTVRIAY